MDPILDAFSCCALFNEYSLAEIKSLVADLQISRHVYDRDEFIAFEEDECPSLGIIAQGSIHVQRIYPSGKSITIDTLQAGSSFGEALIFADDGRYPATLIANEETTVYYLSKDDVIHLCAQSPRFLNSFLKMLSNRVLMLNKKIKGLSFNTVRQKVANYILEEYIHQKSLTLKMIYARHELADALGIPRPSLSRELISLKTAYLIDFNRTEIRILDLEQLEKCLA
ncbi:MAG: Crp/Fnr family transcriptional regulator [Anaerolineaceae bacterium]|nr:Crp/Fnr family transcriptional regulator [Anaerolineaceae bacterium]